ncbi:hypothetical protein MKX03_034477 [Papaver bracteatum]|nr:hypothetical protein MKX03_034477 [Papaver bracteatum]
MPRSSRHKSSHHMSHQDKQNPKDVDFEEAAEEVLSFKEKNGIQRIVNLLGNGGGDNLIGGVVVLSSSKRRKEKGVDGPEKLVDEGGWKPKVGLKSKSSSNSRRHEDRKSESIVVEKEEVVVKKSVVSNGKVEVKTSNVVSNCKVEAKMSRSDEDSSEKEVHHKESTEEKESRSSEREKKNQDVWREAKIDSETLSMKKDVVNSVFIERQKHDELRNPELERELKKRIRTRRDGYDDKAKYYDDGRDASRVSS